MVTYSSSNHSSQYKNITLVLFLVFSKLIRKLVITSPELVQKDIQFFCFLKPNRIKQAFENFRILYLWQKKLYTCEFSNQNRIKQAFENFCILYLWQKDIHRCIFPQFGHHLLSESDCGKSEG